MATMQAETSRWRIAALTAAKSTLVVRWRMATEEWLAARGEYLALLDAERTNVPALRRAAQKLQELQEQCGVLTRELQEQPQ